MTGDPDLLAVLEGLMASFENYMSEHKPRDEWDEYDEMMFPRWAAARAAIAKVRGETDDNA